jgi:hypothetical protein
MLYVFLDEAGNFDFSGRGSSFFTLSAYTRARPFPIIANLLDLKHDLWEQGLDLEYFHASEDRQLVRDQVFSTLSTDLSQGSLDTVIVEKRKTHPVLQKDPGRFYTTIFSILLRYVLEGRKDGVNNIMIVCDTVPVSRRRRAIEKGIKSNLAAWAARHGNRYSILFCASKSEPNLQVADYLNWAVFRRWERKDDRSYKIISSCIRSEFDVFRTGSTYFY